MAEEKPKGAIIFYFMGSLSTALFLLLLSSTIASLSQTEPLYLPPLATQFSLEEADYLNQFLTTTPLPVPSIFSRLATSIPLLALLAMISISFFNFSKSALVLSSVLSLLSLFFLFLVSSLLLSITIFASPSLSSAMVSFAIFFLFLSPFFFIARLIYLTSRKTTLWQLANYYNPKTMWYELWPVAMIALLFMIIYLLTRHLVAIIDGNLYRDYLHSMIVTINGLATDQSPIDLSKFDRMQGFYDLIGYTTSVILALCLPLIIMKHYRVAVIIALCLIVSSSAKLMIFSSLIKQGLAMISSDANLNITMLQIVLFSLLINLATLFFLIKKYDTTLIEWQKIKVKGS